VIKNSFHFLFLIIGLIACWQLLIFFLHLPNYLLPSPWQVAITLWQDRALFITQSLPTLLETMSGLLLGILFGSIAAIMLTLYQSLGRLFLPIFILSQAIPVFAIAPLLVIWLGYGIATKIVITILMVFFPVTSAFYDGLKQTPTEWLALAKTMNATKSRLFFYIRLPAALPSLASGIRMAAVYAAMGAIVGEWVGSSHGLGYLMLNANARLQTDVVFATLILLVLAALILYFSVDVLLKKWIWW
jgi:putative hydroxymethylpyrimidine transport system permease protein